MERGEDPAGRRPHDGCFGIAPGTIQAGTLVAGSSDFGQKCWSSGAAAGTSYIGPVVGCADNLGRNHPNAAAFQGELRFPRHRRLAGGSGSVSDRSGAA